MRFKTKITTRKVVWMAPLFVAVLVAVVGWWTRYEVLQTIQAKLAGELETVLEANVTALEIWMRNQERMAETIANDPQVREMSLALLRQTGAGRPDAPPLMESARHAEFAQLVTERLQWSGYLGAQLVTTNREIAGSSGRNRRPPGGAINELHKARFDELFATGKAVIITPFKLAPFKPFASRPTPGRGLPRRPSPPAGPRGQKESARRGPPGMPGTGAPMARAYPRPDFQAIRDLSLMQVAAPVKDTNGVLVGALTFVIRPEDEFTKVLSVARPGDSGETFAFDQNGLMISRSRFDEQLRKLGLLNDSTNASSALTLELRDPGGDLTKGYRPPPGETNRPLTWMIADAVEGGSGVAVQSSRDYRGVPVVGAWRWLHEQGFGVATKIDEAEAYAPLKVLQLIFVSLILLLALCTLGLVLFSYSSLIWRRKFNEAQLKAKHLGQYTLEEKIGEGGMGVVYKANHALLRRETAIKLLTPDRADEYSVRRFEHEVQLTCQLTHPNTIQIYDYGHTPEGIFYYAMELLRGLTVSDLIAQFGPQPEARAIHLLVQVCASLKEAHAAGLIHRDIKPGNIFLCERGGMPDTVKVLDFGLVKRVDRVEDTLPVDGNFEASLVGTPLYMAPETIRNPNQADHRSDIYAVGAVGYCVLTGKDVFERDTVSALCESHLSEAPIPPSQRCSNPISPELEAIILRCLEKSPDKRPQSVGELHAALLGCPYAADWTLEKRAAWWASHANLPVRPGLPAGPEPATAVRATVKIDLAQRFGSAAGRKAV